MTMISCICSRLRGRHLLAMFLTIFVGASIIGCGTSFHPKSSALPAGFTKVDDDKDNDVGSPYDDTSQSHGLGYSHTATPAQRQAIANAVVRYYAAAVADRGKEGCTLLSASLAESAAEDYGRGSAGPSYLRNGTTCPDVMTLFFAHMHRQLTIELPSLSVSAVRLAGNRGLVILRFGVLPEREIPVIHEAHSWKILALLDTELP